MAKPMKTLELHYPMIQFLIKRVIETRVEVWENEKCCENGDLKKIQASHKSFDSSVGRALQRHRKDRGFEFRSELEFFSGLWYGIVCDILYLKH